MCSTKNKLFFLSGRDHNGRPAASRGKEKGIGGHSSQDAIQAVAGEGVAQSWRKAGY